MNIDAAMEKARGYIEAIYDKNCDVFVTENVRNTDTGIFEGKKVLAFSDVRCGVSYLNSPFGKKDGNLINIGQIIKIYMSPDILVKAGSVFAINDKNGKSEIFEYSGISKIYPTHQEVEVEKSSKWA